MLCVRNQIAKPSVNNDNAWIPSRRRLGNVPPLRPTSAVLMKIVKSVRQSNEFGKPKTELCQALSTLVQLNTLFKSQDNTASLCLSNAIFSVDCKNAAAVPITPP